MSSIKIINFDGIADEFSENCENIRSTCGAKFIKKCRKSQRLVTIKQLTNDTDKRRTRNDSETRRDGPGSIRSSVTR